MTEVANSEERGIVTPSGARFSTDKCPACNAGTDQRIKTLSSEFCGACGHEFGGTTNG